MRRWPAIDPEELQRPDELERTLDRSELRGHFLFGRSTDLAPERWERRSLDGWELAFEDGLQAVDVLDGTGSPLGWLVGHPLDLRRLEAAAGPVATGWSEAPSDLDVRRVLDGLAGRYVLVLPRAQRVYPDGSASLPVLFRADAGLVSSSPFLLAERGRLRNSELVDVLEVSRSNRWFLLGTTPLEGAERVLPNHRLDLASWSSSRTWPTEPLDRCPDVGDGLEQIATTLEATMTALASFEHRPNLGFTSGFDSRTLLACSRGALARIRLFTTAWPDESGATDVHTAPRLARELGLDHRTLRWRRPTVADVKRFMVLTGTMVGERRGSVSGPTWAQLDARGAYVSGVGGESMAGVGVGAGWRPGDRPGMDLDGRGLLDRYGFPAHPELLARADGWLAGIPAADAIDALALFQFEQRFGCWGGALAGCYPDAYTFAAYPYGHRLILEATLRLPLEYRLEARVRPDVIAGRWPELLDVGFNRAPTRVVARRAVERPLRRALRPLKRRLLAR